MSTQESNTKSGLTNSPESDANQKSIHLSLEEARTLLVSEQLYYATALHGCVTRLDDNVKTAGVCINPHAEIELWISPKFWNTLSGYHPAGLLMHEMLHLLHKHLLRGKHLEHYRANVAMDLAINQMIPKKWLPPKALLPEKMDKSFGVLEEKKGFEYYYLKLENIEKDLLKDLSLLDDHDWNPYPSTNQETEKIAIDSWINKTVSDFKKIKRGAGTVPLEIQQLIDERFKPVRMDWKKQMKGFIGTLLSTTVELTRNRINRRYGLLAPGTKRVYKPKVKAGIDSSASVSDDQIVLFLSHIRKMLQGYEDEIEVFFFDTKVSNTKLNISKLNKMPPRFARGGTCFQAAIDYANEDKPDLLIIFTDGDAAEPKKPNFPVIWAVVGDTKLNHLFGKKVYIDLEDLK